MKASVWVNIHQLNINRLVNIQLAEQQKYLCCLPNALFSSLSPSQSVNTPRVNTATGTQKGADWPPP